MKKLLITALSATVIIPSAFASITYNDTITYINGTGNFDTGWVSSTSGGIELAIRADDQSGLTPNNGAGTYTFSPGEVLTAHGLRATWNYQFTVNSDPSALPNTPATVLTTYNYWLTASVNGGPATAPFNLFNLPDNAYGNNGTANGAGTVGTAAALASLNNILANSENIIFSGDPNTGGVYQFDLYATAATDTTGTGAHLDDVTMTVVVPEAGTYWAAALLLLPLGVSILRKRRTA